MLKLALKVLAVFVTIVIVAFISAAIAIPKQKTVTQETEINASRETVWQVLNDREKYPEWQDQLKSIEVKDDTHWSETTVDGQLIEIQLIQEEEPANMRIAYSMGEHFKGEWTGELRRLSPEKTIIRTTDRTEVDSVLMKVTMAMFFDIEEFAKSWNRKLKKRAEAMESKD